LVKKKIDEKPGQKPDIREIEAEKPQGGWSNSAK
jgi:hypothetical protein